MAPTRDAQQSPPRFHTNGATIRTGKTPLLTAPMATLSPEPGKSGRREAPDIADHDPREYLLAPIQDGWVIIE
jgi:hypothetical protein